MVQYGRHTSELAHQTFTCRQSGDDAATGDTLQDVLAVPGDEVAIVDNVFLVGQHLRESSQPDGFPGQAILCSPSSLTSFLMMAPKLVIQRIPTPLIL